MRANPNSLRIALIGFGEVGRRFADDLMGKPGLSLSAFDILRNDAERSAAYERAAAERNVDARASARAACEGADLIVSAVTAAAAEKVAAEASGSCVKARFSSTSIPQHLRPNGARARILQKSRPITSRAR
jgi:3-hydroxyisobutyrate dehydrogenase-like beta-hydroxyacid dehydrogenase